MRDLASNLSAVATLGPAVQAATLKGTTVDLRGFDSAALLVTTGAIVAAGLFAVTLEESDTTTDGDFATVAAGYTNGSPLPTSLAADTVYELGYIGSKRYIRAVITKTSGTSIAAGAIVVRGNAAQKPA